MDWREKYEQAAARYRAGEGRAHDERQLVQLGNAAWAAGLCLLMLGDRPGSSVWLVRSAARYRESWDAGAPTDAWGRPIAAMKALLIARSLPVVRMWPLYRPAGPPAPCRPCFFIGPGLR